MDNLTNIFLIFFTVLFFIVHVYEKDRLKMRLRITRLQEYNDYLYEVLKEERDQSISRDGSYEREQKDLTKFSAEINEE